MSAMALATSRPAPPPTPTMESAEWSLNASTPAVTWLFDGFPPTSEKIATSSPADRSPSTIPRRIGSAARPRSVTTSGRFNPCARRSAVICDRTPGPKWMRVGNWNVWCSMLRC